MSHYWFSVVEWVLLSVFSVFCVFRHLVIAPVWPQHQETNTNSKAQSRKKKESFMPLFWDTTQRKRFSLMN